MIFNMLYYLYKITNTINNMIYIGQHSTNDINDRYMGSGKLLKRAYNKYGIENFEKTILRYVPTKEDLDDLERWIVDDNFINRHDTYNIIRGGSGGSVKGREVHRKDSIENIDLEELEKIGDNIESLIWPDGPVCPKCSSKEYYNTKDGRYKCKDCRKLFSIKTSTKYNNNHLDLKTLLQIEYLYNKGISRLETSKVLGIAPKTINKEYKKLKMLH